MNAFAGITTLTIISFKDNHHSSVSCVHRLYKLVLNISFFPAFLKNDWPFGSIASWSKFKAATHAQL